MPDPQGNRPVRARLASLARVPSLESPLQRPEPISEPKEAERGTASFVAEIRDGTRQQLLADIRGSRGARRASGPNLQATLAGGQLLADIRGCRGARRASGPNLQAATPRGGAAQHRRTLAGGTAQHRRLCGRLVDAVAPCHRRAGDCLLQTATSRGCRLCGHAVIHACTALHVELHDRRRELCEDVGTRVCNSHAVSNSLPRGVKKEPKEL